MKIKAIAISVISALTVFASAAYADAKTMVFVNGEMDNQVFNVNSTIYTYQFVNNTHGVMEFTLTVDSNSPGGVLLECWHKPDSENSIVLPGETSKPCRTDDAVRIATVDSANTAASGHYTIKVLSAK
ncbi:MAG: hypothetical protein ABI597_05540 [Gammaproteobacteria bacterium]